MTRGDEAAAIKQDHFLCIRFSRFLTSFLGELDTRKASPVTSAHKGVLSFASVMRT